jgi:hypothetical protein
MIYEWFAPSKMIQNASGGATSTGETKIIRNSATLTQLLPSACLQVRPALGHRHGCLSSALRLRLAHPTADRSGSRKRQEVLAAPWISMEIPKLNGALNRRIIHEYPHISKGFLWKISIFDHINHLEMGPCCSMAKCKMSRG